MMPVNNDDNTKPGDIYLGPDGDIYYLAGIFSQPSATIENLETGKRTTGAIGSPWSVTAISLDHEVQRLELIEQARESGDIYVIEDLLAATNIARFSSL